MKRNYCKELYYNLIFKGAGGVDDPEKVEIEFTVVPATRYFLPDQKILFLAQVIGF